MKEPQDPIEESKTLVKTNKNKQNWQQQQPSMHKSNSHLINKSGSNSMAKLNKIS